MPKTFPIQEAFTAGELSPLMYGRVSSDGYKSGLKTGINLFTTSHGPFFMRWGFKFLDSFAATHANTFDFKAIGKDFELILIEDDMYVLQYGSSDVTTISIAFTNAFPYSDEEIEDIWFLGTSAGTEVYFFHKDYPTYKLVYDGSAFEFKIVAFTAAPVAWTTSNYPQVGVIHRGRMWVGGCPSNPGALWGSRADSPPSYEDFTIGASDDDAISVILDIPGDINWMASAGKLVVGTDSFEVVISSDGAVITPGDIQADTQSAYGGAKILPINMGGSVVYVTADKKKLMEMSYDWQKDKWVSVELMFASEHLTTTATIEQIAFAKKPNNLLAVRLSDGTLLTATYDTARSSIGWHRHSMTGTLLAICAPQDRTTGVDHLHIITNRGVVAGDFNLEELGTQMLDCYFEQTIDGTDIDTIPELAGETVGVILDPDNDGGMLYGNLILDESGDGTLDYSFTGSIVVGFRYNMTAELLPAIRTAQFGSTGPTYKKWNKVFLHIYESALPKVNGWRNPSLSHDQELQEPLGLITDVIQIAQLGWDKQGILSITQDVPFPTKILCLYGELNEEVQ